MRTMQTYNQVTFTSTPNYCELAIENKDNRYVARYWKNGDREFGHNCYIVPDLPNSSPLVKALRDAVARHSEDIAAYIACKDTVEGSKLYWRIQHNLQGLGSSPAACA